MSRGKGRHAADSLCRVTWGQCDVRSSQSPENESLPHVCGEGASGHEGDHRCLAPGCTAHRN